MSNIKFQFSDAKNGEKTCSYDGRFLHSKYNPAAEAQKFVQTIQADFEPRCIFIIEPALSYCSKYLKLRFPKAELCAIRFSDFFADYNEDWSKVLFDSDSLSDDLFNAFGEEKLCSSLFFDWTPSRNLFTDKSDSVWIKIKNAILKSRNVMLTREYFSKRWTKNFAIFVSSIKNCATVKNSASGIPIIIAASGTSLRSSIDFLKKYRESYFLIAVSSAFMPLFSNGITADLVISTDGGYWAKKHLDFCGRKKSSEIFALSAEGAVPKNILKNETAIPLLYDDCPAFQKTVMNKLSIPCTTARRNGTVSGTALELALNLTDGAVFFCGLDQAPSKEYQHTQPNALESEWSDSRLFTKETRLTSSRFNSETSLKIYREWFISFSQKVNSRRERVFRLSDNFEFPFSLGKIRDVNWDFFQLYVEFSVPDKQNKIKIEKSQLNSLSKSEIRKILTNELTSAINDEKMIAELFPMDTLLFRREIDETKKMEMKTLINEKALKFISEITEEI